MRKLRTPNRVFAFLLLAALILGNPSPQPTELSNMKLLHQGSQSDINSLNEVCFDVGINNRSRFFVLVRLNNGSALDEAKPRLPAAKRIVLRLSKPFDRDIDVLKDSPSYFSNKQEVLDLLKWAQMDTKEGENLRLHSQSLAMFLSPAFSLPNVHDGCGTIKLLEFPSLHQYSVFIETGLPEKQKFQLPGVLNESLPYF